MKRTEVRDLMKRINRDAERIASHFELSYESIKPERANVRSRYGICYSDGSIRIRLRHASSGRPLKYSSLVNTLCHELAHLQYFNHGVRFQGFYRRLLRWARDEGIYQPRIVARRSDPAAGRVAETATRQKDLERPVPLPDAPQQLTLFG